MTFNFMMVDDDFWRRWFDINSCKQFDLLINRVDGLFTCCFSISFLRLLLVVSSSFGDILHLNSVLFYNPKSDQSIYLSTFSALSLSQLSMITAQTALLAVIKFTGS